MSRHSSPAYNSLQVRAVTEAGFDPRRILGAFVLAAMGLMSVVPFAAAQDQEDTPANADQNPPTATQPATSQPAEAKPHQWYYKPKTISGSRSAEPVDYAKPLSDWGVDSLEPYDWLLFGIEQRTRFEIFDDIYTEDLVDNEPFLMRSRAFLGIENIIDPLRFGVEFQDSREFNSLFPDDTSDVNENDFLQAYGELYFKDLLGPGEPLSFQVGRLAIDYVDRRLRSRNGFRNTTNSFDGFRLHAGELESLWELEFFAVQPVTIRPRQPDHSDEERWFYGLVGAWRGWAPIATFEPYYFILDQDNKGWDAQDVDLHTFGMRTYGDIGKSGFDYDVDVAFQYGRNQGLSDRAFAAHTELGYTFSHPWKPRLAAWLNYASGDRSPNDNVTQRFNRLFGSSNGPYGFTDYFEWSNMLAPAMEIRLDPDSKTRFSALYRANWLASKKDAWVRTGRVDPEGDSGSFVGQEIDLFLRRKINEHLTVEIGYAYFIPGPFAQNTGEAPDSDRFFVQTILRL